MSTFYTDIGPLRLQTFALVLALAVMASIGLGLRGDPARRGPVMDSCLGALVLGVIGARMAHILLNWDYFRFNSGEMLNLPAGGLDWHGGLLGALLGLGLVARWRNLEIGRLLDRLAPALPLIALAGWWGCRAANCAYGLEVDTLANYPPLLVAELRDVYGIPAPRYNTQGFGLLLGLCCLGLALLLRRRDWQPGKRFWLLLALLSLGMFAIGFARGDVSVLAAGLRVDQWLDLLVLVLSVVMVMRRAAA
jgi:phosphatidylglycerol:prolipoprotein diacylglycerol transferase